jgi:hypothetical protein
MWKPDWTARVRYRANTMWMLGGPAMGAGMSGAKAALALLALGLLLLLLGGFGGLLAGAAGLGC